MNLLHDSLLHDDPGLGTKPAPGELAYVQAFVNTKNVETDTEVLQTPEQLQVWLTVVGLLPEGAGRLNSADLDRALALRKALQLVLLGNSGMEVDPAASALIEGESLAAPAALRFDDEGLPRLEGTGAGMDLVISRLLAAIAVAAVDGTWRRLKACRSDSCLWAFYDASRNGSGAWCTMSECGNRAKARRFRSRHAAGATA